MGHSCRIIHSQYWISIGDWFNTDVNEVPRIEWVIGEIPLQQFPGKGFFFIFVIEHS